MAVSANAKLKELHSAAEKIDVSCKALDTYHKLEDYKNDDFAKALTLISELQVLVGDYRKKQNALQLDLEVGYKKLTAASAQNAYHKADEMMRAQVGRERAFLDLWTFNINEDVHTGWPVEKLEQSILDTDTQLSALQKFKPPLQYPASSMWTSFQSSLSSVLSTKRNGLDEYNFEAKKSDKHSNDVYLGLINYVNGTLVSDYNMFLQYAEQNGYRGLKLINYVPGFEIRVQEKVVDVEVKKFNDIPRKPVSVAPIKTAVSKPVYSRSPITSATSMKCGVKPEDCRVHWVVSILLRLTIKHWKRIPVPVGCLSIMKIFKFPCQVTKRLSLIVRCCRQVWRNP